MRTDKDELEVERRKEEEKKETETRALQVMLFGHPLEEGGSEGRPTPDVQIAARRKRAECGV